MREKGPICGGLVPELGSVGNRSERKYMTDLNKGAREGLVPMCDVHVCAMNSPADTSVIEKALSDGTIDARDVVAVVGKSEGSGLPNDYGRLLADLGIRRVLAKASGRSEEEIADSVTIAISGGSPGTVVPHASIFTQRWVDPKTVGAPLPGGALVLGRSHTTEILPQDIGRSSQVLITASAVSEAMADAGVSDVSQVHMVLVKGPALTAETISRLLSDGIEPVTRDPGIGPMGSMCYSNDAMALGVAVALGEVDASLIEDEVIRNDWSLYSNVAGTSSGGEKRGGEVLVIANRNDSASGLRAGHGITSSLGNSDGIKEALRSAGLRFECCPDEVQKGRIAQVLGKFTLPGSADLAGGRSTLLGDHEAHHVAKAVGGAVVMSVTGISMAFISGGEANSHMGPPGGNPICALVRVPR